MVNIDEIIQLIHWNRSKEEQQKGIEMAKSVENLDAFILPAAYKPVLENCAKILASRSDEKLKPYLHKIMHWLDDLNWPGADIIIDRLNSYKEDESFEVLFMECYIRAKKCNDSVAGLEQIKLPCANIPKILELIRSSQSNEDQEKGIEMAKDIINIRFFIGPDDKSTWKNCARILASRSDEELKEYLFTILWWLQDINWDGSNIIIDRLLKYEDDNDFNKCYNDVLKFTSKDLNDLDAIKKLRDNKNRYTKNC